MTIALAINVGDALVLASDSAVTQQMIINGHADTTNVWNSANKIFNVHRDLPLGVMMWGDAVIGERNVATHMKDFRESLMAGSSDGTTKPLTTDAYQVEEVADRLKAFILDGPGSPSTGFLVAGYSANSDSAEWYELTFHGNGCHGVNEVTTGHGVGASWYGMPEAISRLLTGVSPSLPQALLNLGVPQADVLDYVNRIQEQVSMPVVFPGMPVGEVIDLADFLVDVTIKFVRFTPGDAMVGGPIEIAALTKHEGFKWIRRKHHYPASLNP